MSELTAQLTRAAYEVQEQSDYTVPGYSDLFAKAAEVIADLELKYDICTTRMAKSQELEEKQTTEIERLKTLLYRCLLLEISDGMRTFPTKSLIDDLRAELERKP